jgi:transposase
MTAGCPSVATPCCARCYEAAESLLTHSGKWSWLKAWGLRVAQRRGIRRAIGAVARRLAAVLHRMWIDGSEFRWSKNSAAIPAVASTSE